MNHSKHTPAENQTRRALLDAGRQLFASKGFKAASIRDIVALADANLGAVTYHYGSKEALYHAVIEDIAAPMRARLSAPFAPDRNALDLIEEFLRGNFAFLQSNGDLPRIVLHILASEDELPPPGRDMIQLNLNLVMKLIERGQADGSIRPGDPRHIALGVAGQVILLGIYRRALQDAINFDPFDPATANETIDDIVAFVRNGLATPERK